MKGPGSVLYGSEAFACVINVITTTPERDGASALDGDGRATAGASALRHPKHLAAPSAAAHPLNPVDQCLISHVPYHLRRLCPAHLPPRFERF